MDTPTDKAKQCFKTIGKILVTRRLNMDPTRHRTRDGWAKTVSAITGLPRPQRTIIDLETGVRDSYTPTTLDAMEKAYQLHPGTLGPALRGESQLISDDGQILHPTLGTEPLQLPDPDPVEQRMLQLAEDVKKSVAHLTPEFAAEVVSAIEAQVQLVMDAKLYRVGYRK